MLLIPGRKTFIWFEAEIGGTAFFKLPVWVPELIIPVTFGLMTLRYTLRLLNEITDSIIRTSENKK